MKPIFKLIILFTFLYTGSQQAHAQQGNLFNTYVYDPMQLNIAWAAVPCTEANLHYRTQWIGLANRPTLVQLNAHAALGSSNGIALRMSSQKAGLYDILQGAVGYAYRIKIAKTKAFHFGLGVGFIQNTLNTQKAIVIDTDDQATGNSTRQKAVGFDCEIGAMYVSRELKIGVSTPHVYTTRSDFSGSTYKTLPQLNMNISYTFNKGEDVEIEPWLVNIYSIKGNNVTEGLLNFNFMETITTGIGYRSNYGILFFLGIKAKTFKAGYSFDYGKYSNKVMAGSSHQILFGFSSCKTKEKRSGGRGRKIRAEF